KLDASFVIRSARILICSSDSSPETYKTLYSSASVSAVWSKIVDFPIPGSPPIKISEPSTMPPPNTRSNSPLFVCVRGASFLLILDNCVAFVFSLDTLPNVPRPLAFCSLWTIDSSIWFQAPQFGHLPYHFGYSYPHAKHSKTVFVFAICRRYPPLLYYTLLYSFIKNYESFDNR